MHKLRTNTALAILFLLFFGLAPVNAWDNLETRGLFNSVPAPWLLKPAGDSVNLAGQDSLEFKWKPDLSVNTDYYDLRVYKGYDMLASTLIAKEKIPANQFSFKIKAETFETGQTYTWSLRRVILSGEKSDKSFSSFKVSR